MTGLRSLLILVLFLACAFARAGEGRTLVSLDGEWSIAEGSMDAVPERFTAKVPVPGLVDMAQPAFAEVGMKSARRQAFWYRRTFKIDGPVPAVALIKTRQAMFGARVILNGKELGASNASFSPNYYDAIGALKGDGAENDLLIRVGAYRDAVPPSVPAGWDFEKIKYIPGIFDSVDLILTGAPTLVSVQAVPLIDEKTVRVQAVVRGGAKKKGSTYVEFVVREVKNKKEVGRGMIEKLALEPGKEQAAEVKIPLLGCRLWSPEDPFLYTLEVRTTADSFQTRFGMRTFKFDHSSGRAVLNGKPYFMRGSNVCVFRFAEDPDRGDKIWREEWVRRLHERFKDMHWNCLRYCIGFPPEKWYEIADELGIMIQDEFPIWHLGNSADAPKSEEIGKEYAAWMRERWNHPCVVIWDAQNETLTEETGKAIQQVRALDLSGRPWDNGWAAAMDPGDSHESHPYHFSNANYKLEMLARENTSPRLRKEQEGQGNAVIVNEYGWLWLNRDGSTCTLTDKLYQNLLGTASTAAGRLHLYARYMAAETEFWRAHRKCAAVMHFCGLGYSRPDGQTSDHWIDLEKLTWEPEFYEYVRDAFAPVGLMIDYWAPQAQAGAKVKVPVIVINDLDKTWVGKMNLALIPQEMLKESSGFRSSPGPDFEKSVEVEIPALGTKQIEIEVAMPAKTGDYLLSAALVPQGGGAGKPVRSLRDVTIVSAETIAARQGLAVGKKATASSTLKKDGQVYPPELAFDGRDDTRWSSDFADDQWIAVDLGRPETVMRVVLAWESAYASEYALDVSPDGRDWKEVLVKKGGAGGTEEVRLPPTETRWVRLRVLKRATKFGASLYEMKLFRR